MGIAVVDHFESLLVNGFKSTTKMDFQSMFIDFISI